MQLSLEKSKEEKTAVNISKCDVPEENLNKLITENYLRKSFPNLPSMTEGEVVRHFINLSKKNFAVDIGFYPLGSCTMKYNPKINEDMATLPNFLNLHPKLSEKFIQGSLELVYNLEKYISELTGMQATTLFPFAGAHGEFCALKLFNAYFKDKQEKRNIILIPDSAHGTNPASASLNGFKCITIKSNSEGLLDVQDVKEHLNFNVAGVMITNPNTLGLFEKNILQINDLVHKAGALCYCDGANFNAVVGKYCPGDMGFDAVHLNLHKTFSTPHGGGGPGAGPVCVAEKLVPYLPLPRIKKENNNFILEKNNEKSIGFLTSHFGNFLVLVRAYTYLLTLGSKGLKNAAEIAVLNSNYLKEKLKNHYELKYDSLCKHEFVLSCERLKKEKNITALDIAKRLIDYGFHPPTIYFPLIVHEALMIEPTETETKETIDCFADILIKIIAEGNNDISILKNAPHTTEYSRFDETKAVKDSIVNWK